MHQPSRLGCRAETAPACISQDPEHTQELAQGGFRMPFCCGSHSKGRGPSAHWRVVREEPEPCHEAHIQEAILLREQWEPLQGLRGTTEPCVCVCVSSGCLRLRDGLRLEAGKQVGGHVYVLKMCPGLTLFSVRRLGKQYTHSHKHVHTHTGPQGLTRLV